MGLDKERFYAEPVRRLSGIFGVDRAVLYSTLSSVVPLILGPITALIVATRYSPTVQGFYYTFNSLVAFRLLAEIGLGQAIIQFASHEWSSLSSRRDGSIAGDPVAYSRIRSLAHVSFQWYGFGALFLVIGLAPAGYLFFSQTVTPDASWIWPWIALCLFHAVAFAMLPAFYLLQGCNHVTSFWYYRLVVQILNSLVLWVAILMGFGLWAIPIALLARVLWSGLFLSRNHRPFLRSFVKAPDDDVVNWRDEIWPVQWRIAISFLSVYFMTQLFVAIAFRFEGPEVAGQMGMTLAFSGVILAISASWVITKMPRFGMLVANKEYKLLDRQFASAMLRSVIVAVVVAFLAWLGVYLLQLLDIPLGDRILPASVAGLLFVAAVFTSVTASLAIYLRAHLQEPLAFVYLVTSILALLGALVMGYYFGALGIAASYLLVLACIQFPISLYIFLNRRRVWHTGGEALIA